MALKLPADSQNTQVKTHEPTGITVTFKRIGHTRRTKILAGAMGNMGEAFESLASPGVGVHHWEGVEDPQGKPIPYSAAALDAVVDQVPEFGPWFNDELLKFNGFDFGGADDEAGDDLEGKSETPGTS